MQCGTVFTVLLTLIYLNSISKLYFLENIWQLTFSALLDGLVNGTIQIPYYDYYQCYYIIQIVTDVEVTTENYFPVVGNIPRGRRTRGIFQTAGK